MPRNGTGRVFAELPGPGGQLLIRRLQKPEDFPCPGLPGGIAAQLHRLRHPAVKNMVYDALQYAKQVSIAAASHKRSGDYRGADGDEYLSGFMKQDHPVADTFQRGSLGLLQKRPQLLNLPLQPEQGRQDTGAGAGL